MLIINFLYLDGNNSSLRIDKMRSEREYSFLYNKKRIEKSVEFLKKELDMNSNKKLLEIGCYPYDMTNILSKFWHVVGVDIVPAEINKLEKNVEIKKCDVENEKEGGRNSIAFSYVKFLSTYHILILF